jgi:hypothetical protein
MQKGSDPIIGTLMEMEASLELGGAHPPSAARHTATTRIERPKGFVLRREMSIWLVATSSSYIELAYREKPSSLRSGMLGLNKQLRLPASYRRNEHNYARGFHLHSSTGSLCRRKACWCLEGRYQRPKSRLVWVHPYICSCAPVRIPSLSVISRHRLYSAFTKAGALGIGHVHPCWRILDRTRPCD